MTNEQTAAVGELVSATWHINNTMDDARTWDALDRVREAFGWLVRQQPTKGHIPQQIPEQLPLPFPELEEKK